jgi:hypothetical protein
MENHSECLDVAILENTVKDVKTSAIFNEIEQLINDMTEAIGKIRLNRQTNSSAVREQKILFHNTDIHVFCSIIGTFRCVRCNAL